MSVILLCRIRTTPLLAGLWLVLCAGPLVAQPTSEQQNAIRSNCRSDFMSNCSGVQPGGAEALQCLQRNVAKLSPGCQSAVNALNPRPPQAATTPAPAAVAPAAPSAAPAPQPATAATTPSTASPSTAPRQQPPQRQAAPAAAGRPTAQQQAAIRQSCQSDFLARCSGVQPGGAEALQCLQRNSAQLSPQCRSAVAAIGGGPAAAKPAAAAAPATAAAPAAMPTADQQSAIKMACRRDFMANCRGVPQGGPEALACLQRNAAKLSPDCRTSVAAVGGAPAASAAPAPAAAPAHQPVGPLRRAIRERMMNR